MRFFQIISATLALALPLCGRIGAASLDTLPLSVAGDRAELLLANLQTCGVMKIPLR